MGVLFAAVVLGSPLGASSATPPRSIPHSDQQAPVPPVRPQSSVALANGQLRDAVDRLEHGRGAPPGIKVRDNKVLVEILVSGNAGDVRGTVASLGGDVTGSAGNVLVEAYVPYGKLVALEKSQGVRYVRPPLDANEPVAAAKASAAAAVTPGEEVTKTNAAAWQAAGFKGAGVKVGIVDYFDQTAYNNAVASGDIAPAAGTFCRQNGADCTAAIFTSGVVHGVAVNEIVHEMAPDAQVYLATAFTTADLQAVVNYFAAQGVTIVTRSLTAKYDGDGSGSGPLAAVIADAVTKGVTWFNSAGNSASNGTFSGSYWRGAWADPDNDGWLNFSGTDELLGLGCGFINGFRWSDWGANKTDYDIFLYDETMTLVSQGISDQTAGADPIEYVTCALNKVYYLAVHLFADGNGTAGDKLEFMTNGTGLEYWQNPFSAAAPGVDLNNAGAISVGAVDPWNGTTIASYSSQGPTNDNRIKPELSAASCVASLSYAPDCFNGTSAASPVAAGAAALVKGAGLANTPAQLRTWLLANAMTDRGAAGADNVFGNGELILPAPPGSPPPPPVVNWAAQNSSDFDGDHKTDLGALYRGLSPADSLWFALGTNGGGAFQIYFGATTDIPAPGDYNGDGKTDAVIYRPSSGLWYGPQTGAAQIVIQMTLGQAGDIPIPGDYDGDGTTDPAIWRPSTGLFFAVLSGGGVKSTNFGQAGDVPVPRDYDGDGKTDFGIFRADATPEHYCLWYAQLSGGGIFQIYFGAPGDVPVPGDYNGDKKADAVIYREATGLWYGPQTGAAAIVIQLLLGGPSNVPIPGYYDNNLSMDPAIYNKTTGLWFSLNSGGGVSRIDGLGMPTDVPIQKRPALAGGT